jgi:predicted HNH restriction endonuclease
MRKCTKEYDQAYYVANRDKILKRNAQYKKSHPKTKEQMRLEQRSRREKRKQQIESLKPKIACEWCGFSNPRALVYHHVDKVSKQDGISSMVMRRLSIETIAQELAKCIVLCANCHAIHHASERDSEMLF